MATCHDPEMATQGQNLDELLAMIRDIIRCRFDAGGARLAWPIRLHFLHDPVLPAQVARSFPATFLATKCAAH